MGVDQALATTTSSTFVAVDGEGYERQMSRWSRRLCEPFLDFAGTAPGQDVLDVGCGTGCLAQALVRVHNDAAARLD